MGYCIFNPTGNITALIPDPVEEKMRPCVAKEVMDIEKEVEQVGFLLPGDEIIDGELQMAGGEFCGNASMSAAAYFAMKKGFCPGEQLNMMLRVSGAEDPVSVDLKAESETSFIGRVEMPKALSIIEVSLDEDGQIKVPVVMMPGIAHTIVSEEIGTEKASEYITALCEKLKMDAMGMMLVDENYTRITPVVYVPKADTLFREHSCASGTAALGAYMAYQKGEKVIMELKEPGGILKVEAQPKGEIYIEGHVLASEFV